MRTKEMIIKELSILREEYTYFCEQIKALDPRNTSRKEVDKIRNQLRQKQAEIRKLELELEKRN